MDQSLLFKPNKQDCHLDNWEGTIKKTIDVKAKAT